MTKSIKLPDNQVVPNDSEIYQRYCEATTLSRKTLNERKDFLYKIREQEKRVDDIKYWLTILWKNR